MAIAKVEFRLCLHNVTPEGEEVIFPYAGKWYKVKAKDMPDEYNKLRMLKLWLEQGKLFNCQLNIDLSKPAIISIDLDIAEEIHESYPIG